MREVRGPSSFARVARNDPRREQAWYLTSGDVARLLGVDLKTVHNWERSGYLVGRRTQGGHLRFQRPELVRFMRSLDFAIPRQLGRPPLRVATVACSVGGKGMGSSGVQPIGFDVYAGLFDAVLALASGNYEMLVVGLDEFAMTLVAELLSSMQQRTITKTVATVGVSQRVSVRTAFIANGGDVAVPGDAHVYPTIRWLIGGGPRPNHIELGSLQTG